MSLIKLRLFHRLASVIAALSMASSGCMNSDFQIQILDGSTSINTSSSQLTATDNTSTGNGISGASPSPTPSPTSTPSPTPFPLWGWMAGGSTIDESGTYMSSGFPPILPGARRGHAAFVDAPGNFWIMGGYGVDSTGGTGLLNDLFRWSPNLNTWSFVKGSNNTSSANAIYGAINVPMGTNVPGGRENAATWVDNAGMFWLFGGFGRDSAGNPGYLNDMWKFDPSTQDWTWITGSSFQGGFGNYGAGFSTGNIPGAREKAKTWKDASGHLFMFGGSGYGGAAASFGLLNDLWEFDPSANQWKCVGGGPGVNIQSTPSWPGSRSEEAVWVSNSTLFLFGGYGYTPSGQLGHLNDFWTFTGGSWQEVQGRINQSDQPGNYGMPGVPSFSTFPGGRRGTAFWTNPAQGTLWLMGGYGKDDLGNFGVFNDVWKYEIASQMWTWMAGAHTVNNGTSFGPLGTFSGQSRPGSLNEAQAFLDGNGFPWIFGGESALSGPKWNTLWKLNLPNQ